MKFNSIYLLLVLTILLSGCKKSEFDLEFELPEDISENYDVIYYANDKSGGLTIQAVASVMKGKCQLKGVTKLPTLLYISSRKSKMPLVVYAERGDKIRISGDGAEPLSWNVEGNSMNNALTEWRKENFQTLQKGEGDKINGVIKEYIENHPGQPASLLLLLCYYDRGADQKEYSSLLSQLSETEDRDHWIRIAARADQLTLSSAYPARIETMVMRSFQGGADTIRFNGEAPGFLFFWQNDIKNRKELTDSLKLLLKQYPDSSKRIIADINLDSDSTVWRSSIRKDSVKNIVRLWAPAGLADPAVMQLKVGRVPGFIVLDKEGKQTYNGEDFTLALKSFREVFAKQGAAEPKDTAKNSPVEKTK